MRQEATGGRRSAHLRAMLFTYLLLSQVAAQSLADTGPQAPPVSANGTALASTPVQSASSSLATSPSTATRSAVTGGSGAGSGSATAPSTAIPSASGSLDAPVPGQDIVPLPQWWCADNATYCPGRLLQDVQLSGVFPDSKTFVDKPTNGSLNDTLNAFNALGSNVTVGEIATFASDWFKGEGLELQPVEIEGFNPNPAILDNVTDPLYRAWVSTVHGYWTLLIRATNESALCQPGPDGCSSSLIPLNNTIVVPGGRYREVYYWDSYWILQGLLASELENYALNLLQNFMDLLDAYGFIPNGGRKYYLNRSQPPVFAHMVHAYVTQTGNTSVLERALPLLDAELQWWEVNRTTTVVSPWTNKTHTVAHYAVNNSAPRPEGFVEDHDAAFGTPDHPQNLTEQQRSDLYAELASGAESGWDYTSRWCREPLLNETDNNVVLRTLNVRGIIPVDLTALMASNHYLVAELYEMYGGGKGSGSKDGGGKDSGWGGTSTSHPTGSMAPRPSMSQPASPPAESPSAERPPAKRQGADPALSVPEGANGPTPSLPPMPTPTPQGADPALNPSQGGGDGTPSDPAAAPSDGASSPAAPSPESGSPAMQPSPSPNAESPATQPSPSPNAGSPAAQPSPSPNAGSSPGQASPSPNAGSPAGTPHASTSAGGMTGGYPPSGGNHTGGGGGGGSDKAAAHRAKGDAYKAAVLDLHWDAERAYFYDYNISAHDHSPVYSPAGLWPLWLNITPPGLEGNETMALAIASGQRFILGKYAGVPSVASLLKTGLNWDFPNVWPPHVYSTIKAFETLHRLVPNATTFDAIGIPFDQVAPRQLNLDEAQLPEQPQSTIGNTSLFTNASEPWPKQMVIEIANRYMTDAFCSWYSTGGAIPGVLQQLPLSDLNATGTYTSDSAGHMFEKFNVTDPDAAGGGGEYTVQIGFGWTNGVVLWAAGRYGQYLPTPTCPLIPIVINDNGGGGGGNGTDGGNGTTHDAGANATHAGTNATQAMFRGYRIPRK